LSTINTVVIFATDKRINDYGKRENPKGIDESTAVKKV
jgi:hypothetical protein